jgi:predicted nucleic acid-binding protein
VAERWVVNASPLILLGKAEIISLLPSLCDELVIPAGVVAELRKGRVADAGRRWLVGDGGQFVQPALPIPPALAGWSGGAGEAEVIAWAMANPGFKAVLDDRAARQMAAKQGVKVLGSLRIIVLAKERGLIPLARPVLEKLRGAGAYVSDELINRTIALAGES